jgi:hypothetical protein
MSALSRARIIVALGAAGLALASTRAAEGEDLAVATVARAAVAQPAPVSVRSVVRMALAAARTLTAERAEELGRRARLAGLVPQLKLLARRGLQQDLTATTTVDDDRTNASQGDDLSFEASLTFQLDRLVFAPEQVRLLAVGRALDLDRRKLIEDVVHLFFRRVRLVNQLAEQPNDAELRASVAEVEALLDAYTDGRFGEALAGLPPRSER